jgi:hypothetical protein
VATWPFTADRASQVGDLLVDEGLSTKGCRRRAVDEGLSTKGCRRRAVDEGLSTKGCSLASSVSGAPLPITAPEAAP